ncbi:MAG TPA: hypothetical protein VKA19_02395 [Alphaproteobacteria bacterium]|nr:hypothetical protein [Alphaproteobacteria bacterium]
MAEPKHIREIATGKTPSNTDSLTAADGSTVDTSYGQAEADVISNLVTRQGEIETALKKFGILS